MSPAEQKRCASCGDDSFETRRAPLLQKPIGTFALGLTVSIAALSLLALQPRGTTAASHAAIAATALTFAALLILLILRTAVQRCQACGYRAISDPPSLASASGVHALAFAAHRPAFRLFAVCLALFLTAGAAAQTANIPWGLWYTEAFLFFAPAALAARLAGLSARRFLRFEWPGALTLVAAALLALANFPLVNLLVLLSHRAFAAIGWQDVVERSNVAVKLLRDLSGAQAVIAVAAVSIAAPLGEETLFRGYLLTTLRARLGDKWAIATVAVLFAALHLDLVNFVGLVELAVLFAVISLRARSLWPAIVAHGVHNFSSSLVLYFSNDPEVDPPMSEALGWAALGAVAFVACIALYRFATQTRSVQHAAPVQVEGSRGAWRMTIGVSVTALVLLGVLWATRR